MNKIIDKIFGIGCFSIVFPLAVCIIMLIGAPFLIEPTTETIQCEDNEGHKIVGSKCIKNIYYVFGIDSLYFLLPLVLVSFIYGFVRLVYVIDNKI